MNEVIIIIILMSIYFVYSIHVHVRAGVTAEDRAGAEAGQQGDHCPQKKVSRLSSAVV